jgi:hypothetical protein
MVLRIHRSEKHGGRTSSSPHRSLVKRRQMLELRRADKVHVATNIQDMDVNVEVHILVWMLH